ncbi:MAG: hypothetical protein COA58_04085 [Bacteroidetes bacterium]|nr:MAG: hypothetical protein COA58_04085 [Bacteroidota bacterium]
MVHIHLFAPLTVQNAINQSLISFIRLYFYLIMLFIYSRKSILLKNQALKITPLALVGFYHKAQAIINAENNLDTRSIHELKSINNVLYPSTL